jgi:hypothetical protein
MSASIPYRRGPGLAIALAAALLAGCGTSGPATALPSVGAASAAVTGSPVAGGSAAPGSAAPGGSAVSGTPRPAGAYSLSLPSGWRSVQIGSNYAALAGAYDTLSLPFASSLISQLTALPKSASAYAYDASDATVRSGTLVALTVTEVVLPAGVTLDDFSAVVGQQAALEAEATVPATRSRLPRDRPTSTSTKPRSGRRRPGPPSPK